MIPGAIPHSKSQLSAQYPFVQTSLLGGAPNADSEPTDNPNGWVGIYDRRARIVPLAGAATFPILVEAQGGSRRWVLDTSPVNFDGDSIRIVPQTMANAFGKGAVQDSGGMTDSKIVSALYPAPTQSKGFKAGSVTNSAGYVGGLYAIESGASLGDAPGLTPPFTYCAVYGYQLDVVAPSGIAPIKLPEFIRRGTQATGSGGIGAIPCAFLGCGAGVIRHTFYHNGTLWANGHVLYKWYLDPFTPKWTPGGSLNIGPGVATAGAVDIIEESINLQLPTWLFLQLDAAEGGGAGITWTATITRGGR